MGEVGVPARGGGAGCLDVEATAEQATGAAAQAPADTEQAVVAQADAATDQVKAHEADARCGAAQVGFVGVKPQPQTCQILAEHHQSLEQGLGTIGEQGQIIHVAQAAPDAGECKEVVVDGVEVQIGQKLAGEVADRQPPWPFKGCEKGVTGEDVDGGAAAGAVGQDGAE